ncbi:hypothetical protein [Halobacterium sp. CBA1126]|uniref:hypothetical protein n=1 Tax=Halobacterium TaxID=2239 RepID=UPI0012F7CCFD|nr:hypothetical protein [Halobacterium sp. CBA1126]MUV61775.1 hypothetical protein [Halobacterium sp. CBA1126]
MGDQTFRVLAALRELAAETDDAPATDDIATRAAASIGATERELETLAAVGAAEERDADGERFEPTGMSVEDVAKRVDTVDELDTDERSALLEALGRGDVDPADVLYDVHDARDAAERAAGSEFAG